MTFRLGLMQQGDIGRLRRRLLSLFGKGEQARIAIPDGDGNGAHPPLLKQHINEGNIGGDAAPGAPLLPVQHQTQNVDIRDQLEAINRQLILLNQKMDNLELFIQQRIQNNPTQNQSNARAWLEIIVTILTSPVNVFIFLLSVIAILYSMLGIVLPRIDALDNKLNSIANNKFPIGFQRFHIGIQRF
ncbi:hypothetical protein Mgra_00006034 [Meloidogyne graminicola]|uniref:Uncharacterized protein n=1 Tax=Meloidogyne graminicola TaxID=189291 RepID=A0A8S9ZMR2_9BILA|nr:hypothetical protein Mgra_00006034 [Meloidogyne graminicola]